MPLRRRTWTDVQLRGAVAANKSVAGVLRELGFRAAGGNYAQVQERIAELELDRTHWTGQAHLRGKQNAHAPRRPLEAILRKGARYQSNKLRKRLLREGLLEPQCSSCGGREWLGRAIPLELDHKDGDASNNELENLRLICPNCHALTDTYRGRNAKYPHIPSRADVEAGTRSAGSVTAYAREKGVRAETVRSWRRRHGT